MLTGKVERDWLAFFGQVFAKAMAPDYGTSVDYSKPPNPKSPPLAAGAYVGSYHNDLYGAIGVVGGGSDLALRLGPKEASFPLRHFERDVFTYQPLGENAYGRSAVTFMVGADQQAAAVTIENLDSNGQGTFRRASG